MSRLNHTIDREARAQKEARLVEDGLHQPGIGFPSAGKQKHLLIVRLDLELPPPSPGIDRLQVARDGLHRLCRLFQRIARGEKTIDVLGNAGLVTRPLSDFHFTATVGFGIGFFETLGIPDAKRPRQIRAMPSASQLGELSPYSMSQSDLVLQLGSSDDFINRWVLENSPPPVIESEDADDIVAAVAGWATVTDVHAGFQRVDGRNLQGFNDGVSNPRRLSPLFDQVVWSTDETEPPALAGGTYMVFQKIAHDLDQWKSLSLDEQEEWVGRTKSTGLLLGTLSDEDDDQLARDMHSADPAVREPARARWKQLFDAQSDPQARFFDHEGGDSDGKPAVAEIARKCPAWAHVRKANPRAEDGRIGEHLVFRRGYPFLESGPDNKVRSGLLFVCFQRDLSQGFEHLRRGFLGAADFPVPSVRPFTRAELDQRHRGGRFTVEELKAMGPEARALVGLADDDALADAIEEASDPAASRTGRDGLAGPSENGVTPTGEFLAAVALGGGYYFVPPIPDRDVAQIGKQFFE
jgi:Dyp-type peroxidase family